MQAESPIIVACVQMEPKIGEKKANMARSLEKIGEAAANRGRTIVLPELCNSGYVFVSPQEAFALAETVSGGPSTQAWSEAAHQHDAVIVSGICKRAEGALYTSNNTLTTTPGPISSSRMRSSDSAAIVGPDGFICTYRKQHLWGAENLFSNPAILVCPCGRCSSVDWRSLSVMTVGFRKSIDWQHCKAQTSSACRQIGSNAQSADEHVRFAEHPGDERGALQQYVCCRSSQGWRRAGPTLPWL